MADNSGNPDETNLPADASHLPGDHDARMSRARLSLTGLSIGDAFGQQFFHTPEFIATRQLPTPRWTYTDDTIMAKSVVRVLDLWGRIHQNLLAEFFADEYAADPYRGYGGTAHSILREIADGKHWAGVAQNAFHGEGSMGNGGAMRVAPVGGYFADDLDAVVDNARLSAEVTHAHPDGHAGAIAVAVAAAQAYRLHESGDAADGRMLLSTALDHTPAGPTREGIERALTIPLSNDVSTAVAALGNGSRIVSCDTVPFSLWCAARCLATFENAMWTTVSGLGDRDTTCAIVGGIVSLAVGKNGIPDDWHASREPL